MPCAPPQVPGDTHRDLQVEDDYSGQTFKHILVPIWLLIYNYGTQNYQVVINGYTGADRGQVSQELGENSRLPCLAGLAAVGVIALLARHR